MRKHLLLPFYLFACYALLAQPGQSSFVHYTTDQGLSNDYITDVLKDQQGFLWIATTNGLNRFDGHDFRNFLSREEQPDGLPDNQVKRLTLAPDGSIWSAGNKGICRIDPVSLEFRRYFLPENGDQELNDKTGPVIFDDQGMGWVSAEKALYRFDPSGGVLNTYPIDIPYAGSYTTYLDQAGRIWLTEAGGVAYFNTKTGKLRKFDVQHPDSGLNGASILHVVEDHCGKLWFSSWFKGLFWYDSAMDSLIDFPDSDNLTTAILPEITPSGEPAFWLGGGHSGLFYYLPEEREPIHFFFDPRDNYTHNNYMVSSFYKDETDGSIWIGTEAGLEHYSPISLRFNRVVMPVDNMFGQFSLMSGAILDRNDPSGNTYFLAMWGSGLFRWNRKTNAFDHFHTKNSGLPDNGTLSALQDHRGNLWIGSNGVIRFDPKRNEWRHWDCIPERLQRKCNVLSCLEDREGELWFGTNGGGLFYYNPATDQVEEVILPSEAYLDDRRLRISNMALDARGRIWLATNHRPIRLDPKTREALVLNVKNIHPDYNGWMDVLPMDNGLLYVTSNEALLEMDSTCRVLRKFDQTNGLRSNQLLFLESDLEGYIWCNTGHLLHRLDPRSGQFTYYGTADGLFKNTITDGLNRTADGKIFVGFQNAFNYFEPSELRRNVIPPPVVITATKVMDQERKVTIKQPSFFKSLFSGALQKGSDSLLIVQPGEDIFSIEFAALNFNQPKANRYAYKLEGFNNDWTYTDLHQATYTNLDEGEYLFRVKAANNDGTWNETGTYLLIKVTPLVVQRWYFKLFLLLITALIIFGIWYYRSQQRRRLEIFRESLARDLHDEMGSTLSSIRFFSEFARQQLSADKGEVSALLGRISTSASSLSESMQDIVWAMKRKNDQLEDLAARMTEFGLRLLEARDIDFKTRIDPGFSGKSLSPEVRRNLYLIFKEAVNNAAKYAEATEVELSLSLKKGLLFMKVRDDGKGIDISFGHEGKGGNGLYNMKKRAEEIGGKLEIFSDKTMGTWIEVEIRV